MKQRTKYNEEELAFCFSHENRRTYILAAAPSVIYDEIELELSLIFYRVRGEKSFFIVLCHLGKYVQI